ncbi:MAG: response regulator [Desulfuromonadales bacterium]|nr:response regulator [Desulfuromonadales bacterium]
MPEVSASGRELWILGITPGADREEQLCSYLTAGGYRCRLEKVENLAGGRPLGVILDISPFSDDGWGLLLKIKNDPATRNIPVLLVFLSEKGSVGGVFPVAGFFTLPVDERYLLERLAVYGMTEDAETWDLQALVVSRLGEEKLSRTVESAGFEVVKAYTAKEARALVSIHPVYLSFVSLMLPDMSVFELVEKLRLHPYSSNIPVYVLLKDEMKQGEKIAMSREIAHLISKKQLSCEEFLSFLRRRT